MARFGSIREKVIVVVENSLQFNFVDAECLAAVALLVLAPQVNANPKGCKSYYFVVENDYCDLVATKNKEPVAKLKADNPRLNCGNLTPGDTLCIGYGQGNLPRIHVPDQKCTVKGTFALTFDDGPFNYTKGLLDYLKANKLKATFFLNGENFGHIHDYGKIVKRMYKEGHQIAHHTWSHADITVLSDSKLRAEIKKLEVELRKIIGVVPTFFRPPYGNTNYKSLKLLNELKYRVIKWDVSNDDTVGLENGLKTLKQDQIAFDRTLTEAGISPKKNGHIGLAHDTQKITAQKFAPWAYKRIKKLGYKPTTVAECLGVKRADWYRK